MKQEISIQHIQFPLMKYHNQLDTIRVLIIVPPIRNLLRFVRKKIYSYEKLFAMKFQ